MTVLAGSAKTSIAPRVGDLAEGVYLGGFGSYRQRRATGVHDTPQCRALALSDGARTVVLAALDLVGASGPLLESIRSRAARLTGLPPTSIVIACTHSHASPDMQGLWGGTGRKYERHVIRSAVDAVGRALDALAPVSGEAATTSLDGVVRNRRGWPDTDATLTTLRFRSTSGATVATLVNYACHPTATGAANTEVSRDWCGFAADAVERAIGGVAVYINGAVGDVNPARDRGYDDAARLGEAVAGAAVASLDDAETIDGELAVRMEPLELPVNFDRLSQRVQDAVAVAGPALSVLVKAGGIRAASVALHAAGRADLAQLVAALASTSQRKLIRRDGRTYLPTLCGYFRIGGVVEGFAAPGEVMSRLAAPLRASLGSRHRLFLGLAHDSLGYFIPEDEWMTGRNNNYEESVSFGKHAGSVLAARLIAMLPDGVATVGEGEAAR